MRDLIQSRGIQRLGEVRSMTAVSQLTIGKHNVRNRFDAFRLLASAGCGENLTAVI